MKLEDAQAKADANANLANTTVIAMLMVIAAAIIISVVLGLFINSMISNPLKKAGHMMKEMSMGHFGLRLNMDKY